MKYNSEMNGVEWTRTERERYGGLTFPSQLSGERGPWWEARMVLKWHPEEANERFLQNDFSCN